VKQVYTRLIVVPVKVTVDFKEEEGFYYASVPTLVQAHGSRSAITTVRSADKETAIAEALHSAGYGAPAVH